MKLKINDIVVCLTEFDGNMSIIGERGRVITTTVNEGGQGIVTVEFDVDIMGGHSGDNSIGKMGHCWCLPESHLQLLAPRTKHYGSKLVFNFISNG